MSQQVGKLELLVALHVVDDDVDAIELEQVEVIEHALAADDSRWAVDDEQLIFETLDARSDGVGIVPAVHDGRVDVVDGMVATEVALVVLDAAEIVAHGEVSAPSPASQLEHTRARIEALRDPGEHGPAERKVIEKR